MNLAADIARALPELQAQAESRMSSTCRITVGTVASDPDDGWDAGSGVYDDPVPVVLYEGKCRLRLGNPAPQDANSGESAWAVERTGTLSLPIDGTAHIGDGARVEITGNPNDPGMVGLVLTVLAPHFQTDSTARRLPVQMATRDA